MESYSLDDAIALLCAYRDHHHHHQRQQRQGEVRVVMRLAREPDPHAVQPRHHQLASSRTRDRLEQWWAEGRAGVSRPAPRMTLTDRPEPAPQRSDDNNLTDMRWAASRDASFQSPRPPDPYGDHRDRRFTSTYEVSPAAPYPHADLQPMHPSSYHHHRYPGAGLAPPQQQQPFVPPPGGRTIVVRAQPNMLRDRAGQNGVSWVVH